MARKRTIPAWLRDEIVESTYLSKGWRKPWQIDLDARAAAMGLQVPRWMKPTIDAQFAVPDSAEDAIELYTAESPNSMLFPSCTGDLVTGEPIWYWSSGTYACRSLEERGQLRHDRDEGYVVVAVPYRRWRMDDLRSLVREFDLPSLRDALRTHDGFQAHLSERAEETRAKYEQLLAARRRNEDA